ncbi:hypothetical protein M514_05538 [Trichuris suis]|uniref:Uncharacterized protein n=1 Tax=Trichuris suis TaxID=68888 RepID=A0A085M8S6_9BILA|nr:hypothetical protein M513_05538 [Trichuris suis]KFD62619.1 hypothetical protein M514_05538 [Trichuris suis]
MPPEVTFRDGNGGHIVRRDKEMLEAGCIPERIACRNGTSGIRLFQVICVSMAENEWTRKLQPQYLKLKAYAVSSVWF